MGNMQQVDYRFEDHGSIWLCQPLTGDARENLDQACESCEDFYIRWGNALVVEPRFVDQVAMQLVEEGWTVE